jgi:hypothetical protein
MTSAPAISRRMPQGLLAGILRRRETEAWLPAALLTRPR